jgi:putative ABC transport system substrate-binding protein
MRALGYEEGRTYTIEVASAGGDLAALAAAARGLAARNVDVIVGGSLRNAGAARDATTKIPVVVVAGDLEASGFVDHELRPRQNVTGLTFQSGELTAKRVEKLRDIKPGLQSVALVVGTRNAVSAIVQGHVEVASRALGVRVYTFEVGTEADIAGVFAVIAQDQIDAFVTNEDSVVNDQYRQIALLALRQRIPSAGGLEFAEAAGLIGYGTNLQDQYAGLAEYVDKILKGARVEDLRAKRPTKFDFVINATTAEALGIAIPREVRQAARMI